VIRQMNRFCAMLAALSIVSIGAAKAATTSTALPLAKTATTAELQADTGTKPRVKLRLTVQRQRETWRRSMVRTPRPKKGCFVATYPATKWREVQCVTPRPVPFGPKRGVRPFSVGNGTDFSAQVTGNTSAAEGSFENVVGVTSETGGGTANKYSLQLNTNTFSTVTCAGAANPATCKGWEQFIYSSVTLGVILIQYWLLGYNNPCPAGWNSDGAGSCFANNAMALPVPVQPITSLSQMALNGDITDQVTLTVGGMMFTAPGDNHFPDLSNGWRITEFNIFGDASLTPSADFNAGSTMDVRTRVNSGMGATPPTCAGTGFTFERNNLTLVSAPAVIDDVNWPSIVFTQSNNAPTPTSCDNADAIGDPHLKTFAGLYYDFQASGDFVLVQDAPDFLVQARQASGAPTWPNASLNKGIAMQMGETRVALYVEPDRLIIDGRTEDLADGQDTLLPTGVQVSRRANLYVISSENGNSVRAVLNGVYIDAHVGLGRGAQQPRGLLGNPNRNVNQLVTADGVVLRVPVAFFDLYHGYADGWRVQPNQSLFAEATTIRPGIPDKLFFANHLNPQDRARARAICRAAHITNKTLLDACTLDTVVLNDEAAVRVFVHAPRPRAVIKPVLRESVLHPTR
jgi:VWD domain-containing protein